MLAGGILALKSVYSFVSPAPVVLHPRFTMARKSHRIADKRKGNSEPSTRERAAKDEKARYERFRRRRWGIVKKISEYVDLFDAEACLVIRDRYSTHYYMSGEWIEAPQNIVSIHPQEVELRS